MRLARVGVGALVLFAFAWTGRADAQVAAGDVVGPEVVLLPQVGTPAPPPAPPAASPEAPLGVVDVARFLAGGVIGLVAHEAGHLALDYAFEAGPGLKRVQFGPLPFFAITHELMSPRREFAVASAGFWVQQLGNEVLLSARPDLRRARAPAAKGLFAFNVITSMVYAGGAFAHAGPAERDTRTMAVFLGVDEAAVGAMLLGPAVLDAVRYYRPNASWAKWASRAAKAGMVILVVRRGN